MSELQAIIDAIVVIQKALTPPTDTKAITNAYDEPPDHAIGTASFPAVINLEEDGESRDHAHGHAEVQHTIGMHLLLGAATVKYNVRVRRQWLEIWLAAFNFANTIDGTVRLIVSPLAFDYEPYDWNGTNYAAINFTLEVLSDR